MKRFLILTILMMGIIQFLSLDVATAADVKIGVIDTQRILKESKAANSARAVFLKDVEQKRKQLQEKQNEVQAMDEELKKEAKDMTPQARREKADDLAKELKELKRLKSDLEEELKKKDLELTQKLLTEIRDIVNEYSKKENYTIILEKRTLIAFDDIIDITDKIIRLYDVLK
jgi:outer membrane protein